MTHASCAPDQLNGILMLLAVTQGDSRTLMCLTSLTTVLYYTTLSSIIIQHNLAQHSTLRHSRRKAPKCYVTRTFCYSFQQHFEGSPETRLLETIAKSSDKQHLMIPRMIVCVLLICIYVYMYVYIHIHVYIYTHTDTCVYIYIYIYMHTHT